MLTPHQILATYLTAHGSKAVITSLIAITNASKVNVLKIDYTRPYSNTNPKLVTHTCMLPLTSLANLLRANGYTYAYAIHFFNSYKPWSLQQKEAAILAWTQLNQ